MPLLNGPMYVATGVDLVRIDRLTALSANEGFLRRVFAPSEIEDGRAEHLAGVFAAKEAIFKALNIPPRWLSVTIERGESGRPRVVLDATAQVLRLRSIDVSISHEGPFAVAIAVAVFDGDEVSA